MAREQGSSAEESGRDEKVWIVIYICMAKTQEISLYCCLYLKLAKTSCFSSTK
jgi:hypothetical protein